MKKYTEFITEHIEKEDIAFSYDDGGHKQFVLISGSSEDIERVREKLHSSVKVLDPDDIDKDDDNVWKISAREWLKIK